MSDRLSGEEGAAGFPLLTVLALMAGIFAVGSEELVVSPLLVDMATSFDTTVAVMALSVSAYGVSTAIGALLFAPLGDRFSRRLSLTIGMAAFVSGTLMCAFATGPGLFFTGRALAGLATGAFVPTAYAFVGDHIAYRHRAKAMGILVSSWSISLVLGVPMGSFIGQWANWRWTFGMLSVLGVFVACVLLMTRVGAGPATDGVPRRRPRRTRPRPRSRRSGGSSRRPARSWRRR